MVNTSVAEVILDGKGTQKAIEILPMKRYDPFAACIAGYFLLRTRRLEQQEWMQNLANWFPNIPDGAVIYGASLLRGKSGKAERQEARHYLLEAVKPGIPPTTAGLRLLFDNLRSLAGEESRDKQFLSALSRIRYISRLCQLGCRDNHLFHPP